MTNNTVTVMFPVVVPIGEMCWDFHSIDRTICRQFDNEGGRCSCTLFEQDLSKDDRGVYKLMECSNLQTK